MKKEEKIHNMTSCMLSILDTLKLHDTGALFEDDETLSEMMFRKMKGYSIDLNKELGFTHLKPIKNKKRYINFVISNQKNKIFDLEMELSYSQINLLYKLSHQIHTKYGYVVEVSDLALNDVLINEKELNNQKND